MAPCELILYATPTGGWAEELATFFRAAQALGPTTAQTYPPHCSLTGFFRRSPGRRADALTALRRALDDQGLDASGRVGCHDVAVSAVRLGEGWLGVELSAPSLEALAAAFAAAHGHETNLGEDAVRLKRGLHLSLAYDDPPLERDLAPYAALAARWLRSAPDAPWEVALWQRHPGHRWDRLPLR